MSEDESVKLREQDALALAHLIYDIYLEKNRVKQLTVKEARDILGDEAAKMSDDEIRSLVDDLSVMAKWALEEASPPPNTKQSSCYRA